MVPVELDGKLIYGVVVGDGTGVRVRVTVDEFEQLGLAPGRQVRVEAPGQVGTFLLTAADEAPPFVFLRLVPLSSKIGG
jgi:hypothetical protein